MSLAELTLTEALEKIGDGAISLEEIYGDVVENVNEHNEKLNIYLTRNDQALPTAQKATDTPLRGLPIAVKDNFLTKDLRTTASSTVLENFVPQFSATVINKLTDAGGVVNGKVNLDAWAHGSSTETSQFGRTLNPRNTDYLPGGSSGGSAAAVAADMCIAALGTETAGSIRQPSSWCGTVGLKPTYGRVSRYGIVPMASSTDSPGVISKTVADAALLLNYIAGKDSKDSTTSNREVPDYTKALGKDISGLKIGYLYHDIEGVETVNTQLEKQLKVFEELGATVKKAQGLDPHHAISVYTIVQRGEVSSNLARFDGVRYGNDRSHFGDEAKRRIMLGTYTLSKGYAEQYYNTAQKVRTLFIKDFDRLFEKYDVLVSATSPGYAKKVGVTEGEAMFGELEDMLLEPSSISGLPGISVPFYRDEDTNLYLGMNIVAPMWQEERMIAVADAFEKNTQWNSWRSA